MRIRRGDSWKGAWSGAQPHSLGVSSCLSAQTKAAWWWWHSAWALKTEKEGFCQAEKVGVGRGDGTGSGNSVGIGLQRGRKFVLVRPRWVEGPVWWEGAALA